MRYALEGVVTVVDAVNGAATLDAHEEAVGRPRSPSASSLAKTDLVATPAALARLRERLRALNPGAAILDAAHGAGRGRTLVGAGLFDARRARSPTSRGWLQAEAVEEAEQRSPRAISMATVMRITATMHHDVNRHDASIRAFCADERRSRCAQAPSTCSSTSCAPRRAEALARQGPRRARRGSRASGRDPRRAARHPRAGGAAALGRATTGAAASCSSSRISTRASSSGSGTRSSGKPRIDEPDAAALSRQSAGAPQIGAAFYASSRNSRRMTLPVVVSGRFGGRRSRADIRAPTAAAHEAWISAASASGARSPASAPRRP